ncbi:hypothetical protein Tsubulata_046693 [Turnera subulata]|uniref:Uncharacterized protein n=1 Tax=Turnera subulata TaxID=218843 RepID=A0A9Q0FJ62_9ROSI|nr:hypothetical protein Tsubulata_046693 [Turnera subulata]
MWVFLISCLLKNRVLQRVPLLKKVESEEEEEPVKKKKKQKIARVRDVGRLGLDPPPPDYSAEIRERICEKEDADLKLVIVKTMYKSDVDFHLDRFSMPANQIRDFDNFLTEKEMRVVSETKEGIKVKVVVLEPPPGSNINNDGSSIGGGSSSSSSGVGVVWEMNMRKWLFAHQTGFSLVLTTSWRAVLERNPNTLKPNAPLHVYSFRRNSQLWLVLGDALLISIPMLDFTPATQLLHA